MEQKQKQQSMEFLVKLKNGGEVGERVGEGKVERVDRIEKV